MNIAILRYENYPKFVTWDIPDIDAIYNDDQLLIEGLEKSGHKAECIVWSDTFVNWNKFDLAIIRSTWDYIDRRDEFLQALAKIENSACKLLNPLDAVRWNSEKSYLFDLEKWHIPVVPTYRASHTALTGVQNIFTENHWDAAIFKPTIGGGALDVYKVDLSELQDRYHDIHVRHPHHDYLVQPFIDSIVKEGEFAYVYIKGQFCYALHKKAAQGDYRVQGIYGGTIEIFQPSADDLQQVDAMIKNIPFELLFARMDVIRLENKLVVMEIELIEPILNFKLAPSAVDDMVNAVTSLQ
ncbi:MAG: hypothetical protein ABIQ11_09845 [Saprospiraceae bacterium]